MVAPPTPEPAGARPQRPPRRRLLQLGLWGTLLLLLPLPRRVRRRRRGEPAPTGWFGHC